MSLTLFNHRPFFPLTAQTGFVIDDYWLVQLVDGAEAARYDFNLDLPDEAPKAWLQQFWTDLFAAPRHTGRADQWLSEHISLLDGCVVVWQEDRKDGTDRLLEAVPLQEYATRRISSEIRQWLRAVDKTSAG